MQNSRTPALGFILTTLTLDIVGIGLIVPILPELVKQFSGGDTAAAASAAGWLGAVYALMQFCFAPFFGCLSDKIGRRPVILISQFGLGLDYFLLAYAPSMTWFFAGRVLAGITGANFGAATAYIADISPPDKRSANFGLVGAAFGVGFIIGPLLGGLLGQWGVRVPFLAAGFLTLINSAYGYFVLPESLAPDNRRAMDWARANPVGGLLALARKPRVFGLATCTFLTFVGHQVYPSIWVLYTGYRYGWDAVWNSVSLAVVGACAAIVQGWLTPRVVSALGEWRTALLGLAIAALSYIAYGLAAHGWMMFICIAFGSLGGLAEPTIQGLISNAVSDDEQGAVQGAVTSLESVSGVVGPLLITSLFSYFIRPEAPVSLPGAPFFACALIALAALGVAWRSRRLAAG